MSVTSRLSRREVIGGASSLALGGVLSQAALAAQGRAKVVIVSSDDVIDRGRPVNAGALRRMVERGVTALSGKRDVVEAWQTYIRAGDRVALVDSGTWLLNVPEVVVEIARGIKMAGPRSCTVTYCALEERHQDHLAAIRNGIVGVGLNRDSMDGGIYTIPGRFDRHNFDTIVMTPTLKSHTIAGMSGVVKHFATMSKTHVREYHANAMETAGKAIADEFMTVRKLLIVDALRLGKVTEGPQFWAKTLIFGTDPVATDVIALEFFLRHCETHGRIPPDRHRTLAGTRYRAGIAERNRIDVQELRV